MQGFGMRSDDMARNAIIQRPFNSYGVVEQDSTKVVLDSVNFIGPFPPAKIARARAAQVAREARQGVKASPPKPSAPVQKVDKPKPAKKPTATKSNRKGSKGGIRPPKKSSKSPSTRKN